MALESTRNNPERRLAVDDALAIPLLVNLTAQEQARLIALAERFLQQKRLVALQGFELDSLKKCTYCVNFLLTDPGARY